MVRQPLLGLSLLARAGGCQFFPHVEQQSLDSPGHKPQAASYGNLSVIEQGKADCPVWGPLEFWACYGGLRRAVMLSSRWRQQVRRLIETHQLDPATSLDALMQLAGKEHGQLFYAVLTGFRAYAPAELAALWLECDHYRPGQWLELWCTALPAAAASEVQV